MSWCTSNVCVVSLQDFPSRVVVLSSSGHAFQVRPRATLAVAIPSLMITRRERCRLLYLRHSHSGVCNQYRTQHAPKPTNSVVACLQRGPLDFDDLHYKKGRKYNAWTAYGKRHCCYYCYIAPALPRTCLACQPVSMWVSMVSFRFASFQLLSSDAMCGNARSKQGSQHLVCQGAQQTVGRCPP